MSSALTRRGFVGSMAGVFGAGAAIPPFDLVRGALTARDRDALVAQSDEYDSFAKLAANENPYGPPPSVMKAMKSAFKYANRYGYPDGNITQEIAASHTVPADHVMISAGSGEILNAAGTAFLAGGLKVLGAEPTFDEVYAHVTSIRAEAIRIPLRADYTQDIDATIAAARSRAEEIGFVYLCNPNNPTGRIVAHDDVARLLDAVPAGMPVLIDEAYHHFVDDPAYQTSIPYVLQGRAVIVTRTFSKIAALAGMRLGYAVAPPELLRRMGPWMMPGMNALVKWGGVAALRDIDSQARVKQVTIALRDRTTAELTRMGYAVIPSQTNFFMVDLRRPVQPVIAAFREQGVLVGRPFPPMTQHLRVSVGTAGEMKRFLAAFRRIMV